MSSYIYRVVGTNNWSENATFSRVSRNWNVGGQITTYWNFSKVIGGVTYYYTDDWVTTMPSDSTKIKESGSLYETTDRFDNNVIGTLEKVTVYSVAVSSNGNGTSFIVSGTISVNGVTSVITGGAMSIKATPSAYYRLKEWKNGASIVISNSSGTTGAITSELTVTSDLSLVAYFERYLFKLEAVASTGGTVDLSSWSSGSYFEEHATKTATAVPSAGYGFVGWFRTGNVTPDYTTATASLLVYSADTVYTAKFYDSNNTLTVIAGTGGSATIRKADGTPVTSGTDVEEGTVITVTATPEYNYAFSQWTGSGIAGSSSASYTFTMPANAATLTASFTQASPLTLTLTGENGDMGSYTLKRGNVDIDISVPTAGTAVAPASIRDVPITVTYSGAADAGSSGLKHVELWASKDGGAWYDTELTDTGAAGSFSYLPDSAGRYAFRLVAEDNLGNRSAAASGSGDCATKFLKTDFTSEANVILAANGGVIDSYTQYSTSYPASELVDGLTSYASYWRSSASGTQAIVFSFSGGATKTIRRCELFNDDSYETKGFEVYTSVLSEGDTDWALAVSGELPEEEQNNQYDFSSPVLAKRVKLVITSGWSSTTRIQLREFGVFGVTPESDSLECSVGAPDPATTYGDDVSFSIKFTSSVTGFTVDDITLNKTGTADGTLADFAGEGDAYTVSVTGVTGSGTIGVSVAAEACQDADETLNEASNEAIYTVSGDAEPAASADITLYVGIEYTLTAEVTDTSHNEFIGWYSGADALLEDDLSYMFTPETDDDLTIVAKFAEKPSYAITKRVSDGTVPYSETNDAAVAGCDFTIRDPDFTDPADAWLAGNLICTAEPAEGWMLAGWSVTDEDTGAGSFQNPASVGGAPSDPLEFDMAFNATVTAIFTKIPYTVTVSVDEASETAGADGDVLITYGAVADTSFDNVSHGDSVSFFATASSADYTFAGWYSDAGELVTADNPHEPIITADLSLTAKFNAKVTITAAKSASAEAGGTVAIDEGTPSTTSAEAWAVIGGTCVITATGVTKVGEAEGAIFDSWYLASDTGFTSPIEGYLQEHTLTVTDMTALTARFLATSELTPRYLYIRNYNNNTASYEPLAGILASSVGTEISEGDYLAFFNNGTPPGTSPPPGGAGNRYYEFEKAEATTVSAIAASGLGFMKWQSQYLVPITPTPSAGEAQYELSAAVDIGTSGSVNIVSNKSYVLTAVWGEPVPVAITVKYASACNDSMGNFYMSPESGGRTTVQGGFSDMIVQGSDVVLSASVMNGYVFSGWFSDEAGARLVSADVIYTHTVSAPRTFYAKFEQDTDAIYKWEGGTENKMLRWRSKRYVAAKPFNPSAARVYADAYPVALNLYMASSPNAPVSVTVGVQVNRQDGLRLPMARPEKYMEVEVTATGEVTEIAVGTSMGGLVG